MTFEEQIAKLNEFFFFKEFTFSKTTFQPESKTELELADNIIFLDGLLLIYQVKERHAPEDSTPDNEATWFTGKVIKKGTRQIRDTLRYLSDYCPIEVRNHRGHSFKLVMEGITHFDKLVVYYPDDKLPSEYLKIKHHHSSTAGVIHLIRREERRGSNLKERRERRGEEGQTLTIY